MVIDHTAVSMGKGSWRFAAAESGVKYPHLSLPRSNDEHVRVILARQRLPIERYDRFVKGLTCVLRLSRASREHMYIFFYFILICNREDSKKIVNITIGLLKYSNEKKGRNK